MADMTVSKLQNTDQLISQRSAGEKDGKVSSEEEKLKKACADFEAIFTYYMFKSMRQAIPQSGFFKKSAGTDTYNMLFDQKVAEEMAKNKRGSSLQQILFEQLNNNHR
ncbi:MAG: rod-binding protein [Syntrophaceae bacterium]